MKQIELPEQVKIILQLLRSAGEDAFVVGGCVRDAIMQKPPHDWDICTSSIPERTMELFQKNGYDIVPTGLKHGTITVFAGRQGFEITTFRIDGDYEDGRRPRSVDFTRDLHKDLSRRDFTINAMAYAPDTGLVDPFGGASDISRGVIRCVGDPTQRLQEDALRVMRAIRFAAITGFWIDDETAHAVHAQAHTLKMVSAERIHDELRKLLAGGYVRRVLLEYRDVIAYIIPEIVPCFGFKQNNPYHIYDVWQHIVESVSVAEPDPVIRMTMLLHDIGKPRCYQEDEHHIGHFHGHAKVSAEMAKGILKRLRFSNDELATIVQMIGVHDLRLEVSQRAVKRVLGRMGADKFDLFLAIRKADVMAQSPTFERQRLDKIANLRIIKNKILAQNECFSLKDLAINGRDIVEMGVQPGPRIGAVLNDLLNMVLEDPSLNDRTTLQVLSREKLTRENV